MLDELEHRRDGLMLLKLLTRKDLGFATRIHVKARLGIIGQSYFCFVLGLKSSCSGLCLTLGPPFLLPSRRPGRLGLEMSTVCRNDHCDKHEPAPCRRFCGPSATSGVSASRYSLPVSVASSKLTAPRNMATRCRYDF